MTTKYLELKNLNSQNKNIRYFVTFDNVEDTFIFYVYWDKDCDCAFLSIYDYNNNPIITGRALVNRLIIRNNKLPYEFYFLQINNETYEPTIDNIASEFVLAYDDSEE